MPAVKSSLVHAAYKTEYYRTHGIPLPKGAKETFGRFWHVSR